MTNPLVELQRLGQSPWHDNIRRDLLTSGKLARMVADGDITGLTSNPTIFEQAIAAGHEYEAQIRELASQGKSPDEIFDALAITDIRAAADVFAPVYRRTRGADGYVSIEVAPRHANDTAKTISEAHRLWDTVARPNLMVKIPATPEGVPAIEESIADGLNINVTLIFSLERYDEVMNAYMTGIERRLAAGKPIDHIASVASFFVSRVDTEVDKRLDALLAGAAPDQAEQLKQLKGRSAIANAKLAYVRFRDKFGDGRFAEPARHGARLQRPLWASTSTKNPAYPDVYYVEALIGPDTVDTMPPATIVAYKDHGHPEVRIDRDLDGARAVLQRLADAGVSMDDVTHKLEIDGVASFAKSYDTLIATVTKAARAAGDGAAVAGGTRSDSVAHTSAVPKAAATKRKTKPAAQPRKARGTRKGAGATSAAARKKGGSTGRGRRTAAAKKTPRRAVAAKARTTSARRRAATTAAARRGAAAKGRGRGARARVAAAKRTQTSAARKRVKAKAARPRASATRARKRPARKTSARRAMGRGSRRSRRR